MKGFPLNISVVMFKENQAETPTTVSLSLMFPYPNSPDCWLELPNFQRILPCSPFGKTELPPNFTESKQKNTVTPETIPKAKSPTKEPVCFMN